MPNLHDIINRVTGQPPSFERKAHYDFGKTLGAGAFGVVCQAENKDTGENDAIKVIVKSKLSSESQWESIMDEFRILEPLDHPGIVKMREWFESKDKLYMVTELCTGGELFDRIIDHGSFTEVDAARMLRQVADSVQYLHHRNIVHRDIKPENLLYKYPSENDSAPLMLCDFGVAKSLMSSQEVIMSGAGSLGYAAPEIFRRTGHSKPVDVWSLGVVLYTILSGVSPFQSETAADFVQEVQPGYKPYFYPDYWVNVSDEAKDLVTRMLDFDDTTRLTIDEVLEHPWLSHTESNASVDLLPGIRPKLEARKHWRAAYERFRLVKLLNHLQLDGHGNETNVGKGSDSNISNNPFLAALGGRKNSDEDDHEFLRRRFSQVVAAAKAQAEAEKAAQEKTPTNDSL